MELGLKDNKFPQIPDEKTSQNASGRNSLRRIQNLGVILSPQWITEGMKR